MRTEWAARSVCSIRIHQPTNKPIGCTHIGVVAVGSLQPRQFSIASALEARPGRASIELLVAMVEYTSPIGQPRRGVCTAWLSGLAPGATVPIWVGGGSLKLPADPQMGILCIGPGTGVAPLRSLLQFRRAQAVEAGTAVGPASLYFGCRNKAADFYFEDEWQGMVRTLARRGTLGSLR